MSKVIEPQLGQIVWWYTDGDRHTEPKAAVVTKVGQCTLNVNILDPASYNFVIQDGVRHLEDPACRREELKSSGAWAWPSWAPESKPVENKAPESKRPEPGKPTVN